MAPVTRPAADQPIGRDVPAGPGDRQPERLTDGVPPLSGAERPVGLRAPVGGLIANPGGLGSARRPYRAMTDGDGRRPGSMNGTLPEPVRDLALLIGRVLLGVVLFAHG